MTDRELDALVAEKVMGYVGVGYYGPTKAHGGHLDYRRCATWAEARALYDQYWPAQTIADHVDEDIVAWKEGWGPIYVPDYSTDMAAAWTVVEKMVGQGRFVHIDNDGNPEVWGITFFNTEPYTISDTMPRAICLAALKAVEE